MVGGLAASPAAAGGGDGDEDWGGSGDPLPGDVDADPGLGEDVDDYAADIARGHRQPKSARDTGRERVSGTSWWLGKSREELSAEAAARTAASAKTRIGQSVKGTVNTP